MWNNQIKETTDTVTCPGCGLSCDDLTIEQHDGRLQRVTNGCDMAQAHFRAAFEHADATPAIDGKAVSLETALDHGAALLRRARSPLFAGLATDVNGMRGLLDLADRCGATLDHLNGDALFRNVRVVQDNGWFTTTFTEVRNRADLVLMVGRQWYERFPRLIERVLHPEESLFTSAGERRLVLLGPWESDALPDALKVLEPTVIPLPIDKLPDAIALLRGLVAGRPVQAQRLGAALGDALVELAGSLHQARYSVISWSAAELDRPHAELLVQAMAELSKQLNLKGRSAALPLAGSLADVTSNQVCTWQLGYPLRTCLQRGFPEHDPLLCRWQDWLDDGECDLLLWVSALSAMAPPPTHCPTLVLGHAATRFETPPSLFIPVGVPGVDHPGHWYRSDGVCPLPLGQLRASGLPPVSRVANGLSERLVSAAGTRARAGAC